MFMALLLSLCERRNTCLSTTFWEQICAVVSFFLFSFAVLHLHQITEHGSNSSFEPFACSKKASGRYCGLSKGPRRGVPKSECPLHQGEMSRGKDKVQENMPSSLLSSQENERMLELLGRRCVVSEVTLIRRPIMDGHSVPRRIFWGYKSIRYKRETPERTDMVQKSQMRLELLLLMSVKGQSETQLFKLFRCLCAEWKRWRECIQNMSVTTCYRTCCKSQSI